MTKKNPDARPRRQRPRFADCTTPAQREAFTTPQSLRTAEQWEALRPLLDPATVRHGLKCLRLKEDGLDVIGGRLQKMMPDLSLETIKGLRQLSNAWSLSATDVIGRLVAIACAHMEKSQ